MAKKTTQTVTIEIELTDDILNKLGASIAKAMTENNVLDLPETERAEVKADTAPAAPVNEEQQVTQAQNNTPAEMPATPVPNPNFTPQPTTMPTQGQASAAQPYPTAQGYPVQTPQPSASAQTQYMPGVPNIMPQPATPNYPVNVAGPAQATPMAGAVPTTAIPSAASAVNPPSATSTLTLDMICNAAAALIDNGKMVEVLNILHSYGVDTANALKPEYYPAVADALRALGAVI